MVNFFLHIPANYCPKLPQRCFSPLFFYNISMPLNYCPPGLCMEREKGRRDSISPSFLPSLPVSPQIQTDGLYSYQCSSPLPLAVKQQRGGGDRFFDEYFAPNFRLRPGQLTKTFFLLEENIFLEPCQMTKKNL